MLVAWTGSTSRPDLASLSLYLEDDEEQTEFPLNEEVEVSEAAAQALVLRGDFDNVDFAYIRKGDDGEIIFVDSTGSPSGASISGGETDVPIMTIPDSGGVALGIGVTALPQGFVGREYEGGFTAVTEDEETAVVFSISAGALPDGLEMDEDGAITGIPTEADTFTFTVQAVQGEVTTTHEYGIAVFDAYQTTPVPLLEIQEIVGAPGGTVVTGTWTSTEGALDMVVIAANMLAVAGLGASASVLIQRATDGSGTGAETVDTISADSAQAITAATVSSKVFYRATATVVDGFTVVLAVNAELVGAGGI